MVNHLVLRKCQAPHGLMHPQLPAMANLLTFFHSHFTVGNHGTERASNFAHSHTAGRWQSQSLNTSSSAPECPISTTVLPIISETRVLFRSLSLSPFLRCKNGGPRKENNSPSVPQLKGTDFWFHPMSSVSRSLPGPLPSALPLLSWVWKQPCSWLTGGPLPLPAAGPVGSEGEPAWGAERGEWVHSTFWRLTCSVLLLQHPPRQRHLQCSRRLLQWPDVSFPSVSSPVSPLHASTQNRKACNARSNSVTVTTSVWFFPYVWNVFYWQKHTHTEYLVCSQLQMPSWAAASIM